MKKIAIVCALMAGRNTGMATVDLSAYCLMKRLAAGADVTYYSPGELSATAYQYPELPFQYKNILTNGEEFLNSNIFLYWGDFLHSHAYWQERGLGKKNSRKLNPYELAQRDKELMLLLYRYIFLADFSLERLKEVVVFGSTIMTNTARDHLDRYYDSSFARFFSNVKAVFFRDALSAAKILPYRPNETPLGCDCSLLLKSDDLSFLPGYRVAESRKGIGVFFGRHSSQRLMLLLFARLVIKALGEPEVWIHWLECDSSVKLYARFMGYKIKDNYPDIGSILSELSGCRFVITDTYHLCVNAWRMGIPAICIGRGSLPAANSLADKKKEMFYEMYGARDFYVFTESLSSYKERVVQSKKVVNVLSDMDLITKVLENINHHKKESLRRFVEIFRSFL